MPGKDYLSYQKNSYTSLILYFLHNSISWLSFVRFFTFNLKIEEKKALVNFSPATSFILPGLTFVKPGQKGMVQYSKLQFLPEGSGIQNKVNLIRFPERELDKRSVYCIH